MKRSSKEVEMRRLLVILIVFLIFLPVISHAATQQEIQDTVDDGLAYLASSMTTSGDEGYWNYSNNGTLAATAAAVLAFVEEGYLPGTDVVIGGTNYGDVVGKAYKYIFNRAKADPRFTSIGPGGMETAVVNTLSAGDRALFVNVGNFGDRWVKIAKAYGVDVVDLKFERGKSADPKTLEAELAKDNDIKVILNVTKEISEYYPEEFVYFHYDIYDNNIESIGDYLEKAYQDIKKYQAEYNGNILIHCYMGASRSATILLYYLMKEMKNDEGLPITHRDALEHLRSKRPVVNPTHRFTKDLGKSMMIPPKEN